MTTISSSAQTGAQVALRLLSEAALAGRAGGLPGGGAPTRTALDQAIGASGTRIRLSAETAIDYFGAGSDVAQAIRGRGDEVEVSISGLDAPPDKEAWRAEVLAFLKSKASGYDARVPAQAEFMQALKEGRVIVKTADEVPEFDWKPAVDYTIFRDGHSQGSGGTTAYINNRDLLNSLAATRGQASGTVGSRAYYAYYEK